MPKEDRLTIHIRIPTTLLRQVKTTAVENGHSMNAEIVARLERSFSAGDTDRGKAVRLLAEAISILDKGQR